MQKWEYLIVFRNRGFKSRGKDEEFNLPDDWLTRVVTKTDEKEWEGKIIDLLIKLGDDGWELATTWTRSDMLGGAHATQGKIETNIYTKETTGAIKGITTDFAGFTDIEEWVFKRPRP